MMKNQMIQILSEVFQVFKLFQFICIDVMIVGVGKGTSFKKLAQNLIFQILIEMYIYFKLYFFQRL